MSQGTSISRQEAQGNIEAWQGTASDQLAQTFTNQSSRILVFALSGDPLNAMMEQWSTTDQARFRMHAAVGEAGAFEVLLEIISGDPVTDLQSDTLFVPALTSAEINVPNPEPTPPPQEIAASEAKTMSDGWKNLTDDSIAATVSGTDGRLRYITYEEDKSGALKNNLENITEPTLLLFLAVKTPDLQDKYKDNSDILFTLICSATPDGTTRAQENGYFEFGELCPPKCQ